jgi:uncharacterized membrane protein (UPF0127 family)
MSPVPQQLRTAPIRIKGIPVTVEVAVKPEEQAKGLMFRDSMPEDHGMLFVYSEDRRARYYMLNVRFPIAIAFLDRTGRIGQIGAMEPREEMPTCSNDPVRYVLEMNAGWFEKHGVKVGDTAELPGGTR